MFASKALPDRFPYRVGAVRLAHEGTLNGERTIYDPRPVDPAMHNEPNPILIAFREQRPVSTVTEATYRHARRVLRRLGALE